MQLTKLSRVAISVTGIVQGVGFRPFVHGLASRHQLTGFVRNNDGVVEIEVQGEKAALEEFIRDLVDTAPPLAEINAVQSFTIEARLEQSFAIEQSSSTAKGSKLVPPDAATCAQCLEELFCAENRRFRYPFINCTNCGPRFTIMRSLPYDRAATTMDCFAMCQACRAEYTDPRDRRFHAEPNACARCGPRIFWLDATPSDGHENHCRHEKNDRQLSRLSAIADGAALERTVAALAEGKIVAIKGLGGFHLVCDAGNASAIAALRKRKHRQAKPLALMMADPAMVRNFCNLSPSEEECLTQPSRPIVLLEKLESCNLPDSIAPGADRLGIMLPYTPLHHLLLHDFGGPIIATSGNFSEEPIATGNREALKRLYSLADGFLLNDRDIYARYDDSIIQLIDETPHVLRRARGIAPRTVSLGRLKAERIGLGVGAHLKNTFCLIRDDLAYLSQHIGNLENLEAEEHFRHTFRLYNELFDLAPELIAHDLHPDYLSTTIAKELAVQCGVPSYAVQHHHAHIVSCMAEHALVDPVIGIVFDGMGYGTDGSLWGGEFLICDLKTFERAAHLKPVPMPGGTLAIQQPWRMSLAYLMSDSGQTDIGLFAPYLERIPQFEMIKKQIASKINTPMTSSCGRLFDALSALLGVCQEATYEAQAAIELEALAWSAYRRQDCAGKLGALPRFDYSVCEEAPYQIDALPILQQAYAEHLRGVSTGDLALRFHVTMAHIIRDLCERLRLSKNINQVCLGGGVFQNRLMLSFGSRILAEAGFDVFYPQRIPANDGGLSLGQAISALASIDAVSIGGDK